MLSSGIRIELPARIKYYLFLLACVIMVMYLEWGKPNSSMKNPDILEAARVSSNSFWISWRKSRNLWYIESLIVIILDNGLLFGRS